MKTKMYRKSFYYDCAAVLAAVCALAALGSLSFPAAAVFGFFSAAAFRHSSSLSEKALRAARAEKQREKRRPETPRQLRRPALRVAKGGRSVA